MNTGAVSQDVLARSATAPVAPSTTSASLRSLILQSYPSDPINIFTLNFKSDVSQGGPLIELAQFKSHVESFMFVELDRVEFIHTSIASGSVAAVSLSVNDVATKDISGITSCVNHSVHVSTAMSLGTHPMLLAPHTGISKQLRPTAMNGLTPCYAVYFKPGSTGSTLSMRIYWRHAGPIIKNVDA